MTATTSKLHRPTARGIPQRLGVGARATLSVLGAIRGWWHDVVESAQLGPDAQSTIGRHTGARI